MSAITPEMGFGPFPVTEIRHFWLKLSDDTRLALKLWLPWLENGTGFAPFGKWAKELYSGSGNAPDEKEFPAILEFLPYRKDDVTAPRDRSRHSWLASYGFVCCRADIRGSGSSDGECVDQFSEQELQDCTELLNWLSSQPWSNGKVGIYGISYGGFNGLLMAYRQPDSLKALITLCSGDDRYETGTYYSGGCVVGNGSAVAASYMYQTQAEPPDPRFFKDVQSWKDAWQWRLDHARGDWFQRKWMHQRRDEYWIRNSVCNDYSRITCPVLVIGSTNDAFVASAFRLAANLNDQSRTVVGPWSHSWPDTSRPGPRIDFLGLCLQWYEYHLKGPRMAREDVSLWPNLRVFVQENVIPNDFYDILDGFWVTVSDWPRKHKEYKEKSTGENLLELFLTDANHLSHSAIQQSQQKLELKPHPHQGLNVGEWFPGTGSDLPRDQHLPNSHSLCFFTEPLEQDLVMCGFAKLHIKVSLEKEGIQGVAARLCHEHKDGKSMRITLGFANLGSNTDFPSSTTAQLEFVPNGYVVPKGDRLCLAISPNYFPSMATMPQVSGIWIHPTESKLVVQILTEAERQNQCFFPPPKPHLTMASMKLDQKDTKPPYSYQVHDDPTTKSCQITTGYHDPKAYYPELGLEMGSDCKCVYELGESCTNGTLSLERQLKITYPELNLDIGIEARHDITYGKECLESKHETKATLNGEIMSEKDWSYSVVREFA